MDSLRVVVQTAKHTYLTNMVELEIGSRVVENELYKKIFGNQLKETTISTITITREMTN